MTYFGLRMVVGLPDLKPISPPQHGAVTIRFVSDGFALASTDSATDVPLQDMGDHWLLRPDLHVKARETRITTKAMRELNVMADGDTRWIERTVTIPPKATL